MNTSEATRKFCNVTGTPLESLRADDAYNMITEEANEEKRKYPRKKWEDCVDIALSRMLQWHANAKEVNTEPFSHFIASHRRAFSWTVFNSLELNP